jgi:GNAT superfamily N-acetyltransferase
MELERFDAAVDGGQARDCHEIYLAGAPTDDPDYPPMSLMGFRGWLRYGWSEDPSETWLARDVAGAPCGWFVLTLPQRENRGHGYLHMNVHPARRQAGLGRALAAHAAARALRSGRSLLCGDTRQGSAGAAFARAIGARQGMTDVRLVLKLESGPAPRLAALRSGAEAAARGYSPLCWEGPVPAEHAAQVAAVTAAADDMPTDEGHQAQHWDADRVRTAGLRVAAQGAHYYTVLARHDASGELAGYTQLGIDPPNPGWGFQELTVVARQHRGHRLGMLLKVGMLDLLAKREPLLRRIVTGNAAGNEHMIAINDQLGFEVLDHWSSWEMDVASAITLRACA